MRYEVLPAFSTYQNSNLLGYNTVYFGIDANILKESTNFNFRHCFTLQIKASVLSGTFVNIYGMEKFH
jgi:hypothetical protein